ncbi:MAG: glutamine synthetase III [Acidobacteria bacterium]|nr:glutamine synthetase III [Acidobacteriota bacterium]
MNIDQYIGRRVSEYFAENTFTFSLMKQRLSPPVYQRLARAVHFYEELNIDLAEEVADAMKEWAMARGVTAYTHWFQPLTGLTAEKHDSLLAYGPHGEIIEKFTGAQLIKSEPDASSFPHGGMRSTFEARGYAAWDPSSPAFIMEGEYGKTLCIPSVFVSYDGYVLDKKTPLIKSIKAVNEASLRLLHLLGYENQQWVYPQVGPEQEFFLIDLEYYQKRPDLLLLGYTLFGQRTPRGQQFEDHYFGSIKERVLAFMQELEIELYRLGIPAKTRHNEVAPNQFEIAALHENANLAADHNQLLMEILRRVARRHGFAALLHEKPFAEINGSGKHNNWSLVSAGGENMFSPGTTPLDNLRFLCFIIAALYGVYHHGDLLRAIIATPGNDFRLGSHEAPPAVISVFLGEELTSIMEQLAEGKIHFRQNSSRFSTGVPFIPPFPLDTTDRNRTSPFAFTGNKFEFRAVGSSASIAMPNAVINAVVTDGLQVVADAIRRQLDEDHSLEHACLTALQKIYREVKDIHFDGDNYSGDWVAIAHRRNLPVAAHTADALQFMRREKNIELFRKYRVLHPEEVIARYHIKQSIYINTVELELRTARNMIRTLFLPACFRYERELADLLRQMTALSDGVDEDVQVHQLHFRKITSRVRSVLEQLQQLDQYNEELRTLSEEEKARLCAETIRPALVRIREIVDKLEERVDASLWPVPRYWEMLSDLSF